jgi:hypothetical protein
MAANSALWKPGQSGNPAGRGSQASRLAKRLLAETGDGEEMLQLILGIARGTSKMGVVTKTGKQRGKAWSEASRRWAIETVLDRTHGKAKQVIDLEVGPASQRLDRSKLSNAEVSEYQRLVRKMAAPVEAQPPIELPASAVVEAVATAIALDPSVDPNKAE